jgi:hypothetical protein
MVWKDIKLRNTYGDNIAMESTIHTLQDYMLHTETVTYIIIVAALIGITFFYRFLTERDDDED